MKTLVRRVTVEADVPLDKRIEDLCDVMLAAGFQLSALTFVGDEVLLIFQKLV